MKNLVTIVGFNCIKPKTKQTTDDLKDLHYEVNGMLFKYGYTNISLKMAQGLLKRFIDLGKQIKELEIKKREVNDKRTEILTDLRTICKNLQAYIDEYDDTNDRNDAQRTINFRVAQFIKSKEKPQQSEQESLEMLKFNKVIRCTYNIEGLKWESFDKMQTEIIESIVNKYRF